MGFLWEIVQSGFLYNVHSKSDKLEDRVAFLEQQLTATQNTIRELVKKLEQKLGGDIDGDGRIG
jgi:chaperonin cofactor prefoldin